MNIKLERTVRTAPKSNLNRGQIDTSNTQIHDGSFS